MSDRELLEMAAKAAGLRVKWVEFWNAMKLCDLVSINGAKMRKWNPLTDDGDALRLAVTLREKLGTEITSCFGIGRFNSYRSDPFAATRLAIVRAAAEIGKAEPRAAATTPVLEPAQATQAASAEDMKVYASIADRYFREATQTELTDEQILEIAEPFGEFQYGDAQGHKRIDFARAILALRPAAVPMTPEQRHEIICRYDEGKTYSDLVGIILATEAHSITTKAKGDQ